jgi:hypothetical protein
MRVASKSSHTRDLFDFVFISERSRFDWMIETLSVTCKYHHDRGSSGSPGHVALYGKWISVLA